MGASSSKSKSKSDSGSKAVFYHYTNPDAAKAIIKSGVIRMSFSAYGRDDAAFGEGVYLTQISPRNSKLEIALNNWDGYSEQQLEMIVMTGKCDAYIKLLLDPEDVEDFSTDDRDIFLYPDHDLHIIPDMKATVGLT